MPVAPTKDTPKFKVGDKVVCVKLHGTPLEKGFVYKVVEIYTGIGSNKLMMDISDGKERIVGWYTDRFKLWEHNPTHDLAEYYAAVTGGNT